MAKNLLPFYIAGEIVKGFGRGSKELGCPTANFPLDVVKALPKDIKSGVYFGWASVDSGQIYKAVLNIGWCPFYDNKERSVETHIINNFGEDFYGKQLKLCVCGYLRPELNFESLDALKIAICKDVEDAKNHLDDESYKKYRLIDFFHK